MAYNVDLIFTEVVDLEPISGVTEFRAMNTRQFGALVTAVSNGQHHTLP